jgi:hypothetical protein
LITMQGICGRVGEVHKDYTIGKFYFKVSNWECDCGELYCF